MPTGTAPKNSPRLFAHPGENPGKNKLAQVICTLIEIIFLTWRKK
jgi:hypothetical protein